tara:strand:- start:937 stop:1962 length:1026 start_codon:yes stop_codon:yes gene_type:complete
MRNTILIPAAIGLLTSTAFASDLDLSVESGGSNVVSVTAGNTVEYEVRGVLSDASTQGLAMFAVDLSFTGGALSQANAPTSGAMLSFASPLGFNNPAGFGGTVVGGDLIQAGGGQNTMQNDLGALTIGVVLTDIAQPGNDEVLLRGTLTAPASAGSYTLSVANLFANAIESGSTGIPHYTVEAVGAGSNTALTIDVTECPTPVNTCSAKINSAGCGASMSYVGTPTLSGPDDFRLIANDVINRQFGLVFWGTAPGSSPFFGGTLCVSGSLVRMPVKFSSGPGAPGTNCLGTIDQFLGQNTMANRGLMAGDTVYAQTWYRDPLHVDGQNVGMSDALQFTICP